MLDVIPTSDNWAALSGIGGIFAFHLVLPAQPGDLPERMIGADPDLFFGHVLDTWPKVPGAREWATDLRTDALRCGHFLARGVPGGGCCGDSGPRQYLTHPGNRVIPTVMVGISTCLLTWSSAWKSTSCG